MRDISAEIHPTWSSSYSSYVSKVEDFELITSIFVPEFNNEINAMLRKGYVFHGETRIEHGRFYQAMVKYEVPK